MPTDLAEAETGGVNLFFADDLEGEQFDLQDASVYDAEEVRQEIGGDVPKFGRWMPVDHADGDGWIVALGELIEELQQFENPQAVTFTVTRCEKSGNEQADPYEVNVEADDGDPQQTGL